MQRGPLRSPDRLPWTAASPAGFVLPLGGAALLVLGAVAASAQLSPSAVLAAAAAVVGGCALVGGLRSTGAAAVIGWFVVTGFSRAPYGQLQPAGARPVWVLACAAFAGLAAGLGVRASRMPWQLSGAAPEDPAKRRLGSMWRAPSLGRVRQVAGLVFAATSLPLATVAMVGLRQQFDLADDLLFYLLLTVAVTVVGGLWPAVAAAVAADLLLNWFFITPYHTLAVDQPRNLLALVLFVALAVAVSTLVHLAAGRQAQAREAGRETDALLDLAQTVYAGADTPAQVLEHLRASLGMPADLAERTATRWSTVASAGDVDLSDVTTVVIRDGLILRVSGMRPGQDRLLAAFAAQTAAALDRDRLRTQAAQSEALAAGNRMRTALLAAVSHDLRTPLASVKAAVSSLRQDDVRWSPQDEADLLATIEESADRLDALIGNLLDMSRLQTGSLHPFLRDASLEEVAPLALLGLDGAASVVLDLPADLPLVRTDPGLLERVLGNLLANALRFSPADRPPAIRARAVAGVVRVSVVDQGPGVPVEAYGRIFEPFQRLGDAGTGIGLGLAVAKGFCEAMGVPISVGQTAGGGLTVTLDLRVATEAAVLESS